MEQDSEREFNIRNAVQEPGVSSPYNPLATSNATDKNDANSKPLNTLESVQSAQKIILMKILPNFTFLPFPLHCHSGTQVFSS